MYHSFVPATSDPGRPGSATFETRNAMGSRALDNLDAIFADREPLDRVA